MASRNNDSIDVSVTDEVEAVISRLRERLDEHNENRVAIQGKLKRFVQSFMNRFP